MCSWEGLQCRRDPAANRCDFNARTQGDVAGDETTPAGVTKTPWGNVPASRDLLGHTRLVALYDTMHSKDAGIVLEAVQDPKIPFRC